MTYPSSTPTGATTGAIPPLSEGPFSDPVHTLNRILDREVRRAEVRRGELAEVRNALLQLGAQRRVELGERRPVWELVGADLAPTLIDHLLETEVGTVRTCIVTLDAGPGLDEATIRRGQERIARGMDQRALYPMHTRDHPRGRRWMEAWAAIGEEQRLSPDPPSDFAVFGEGVVMAVADWGDPHANYVLIRDPMLVKAFIALFDRAFATGLPVPDDLAQAGDDRRLLRLLGTGLKDEAIARYLGVSLRTVRRRVSRLMAEHGAETRFQLGVAAARSGLIREPRRLR